MPVKSGCCGGHVNRNLEDRVRLAAFAELRIRQGTHGEVLPLDVIKIPLRLDGREIPLINPYKGIHKPGYLSAAMTVTTAAPKRGKSAPYDDRFDAQQMFRYHYRDAKTQTVAARRQAENENYAVRLAMQAALPLIYFVGVQPGRYLPFYPVYVIHDYPDVREFGLDLTGVPSVAADDVAAEAPERAYRSQVVKTRIHQAAFRENVMTAYASHCAVCKLRRAELVEAAHIISDSDGGPPVVNNGMGLCKLHHAAFDANVLGIRPDLTVAIRMDVLKEVDGPMLTHGLQDFHNRQLLYTPRRLTDMPSQEFLERRFQTFAAA